MMDRSKSEATAKQGAGVLRVDGHLGAALMMSMMSSVLAVLVLSGVCAAKELPESGRVFKLVGHLFLRRTAQCADQPAQGNWMIMRPFGRISFHSCYDSMADDLELHDTA